MTWQGAGPTGDPVDPGTGAVPASGQAFPPAPPPPLPAPPPSQPPAPPPPGAGPVPGGFGAATVGWAPPTETMRRYGVPGAPGLVFAGVLPRFVAYLVDSLLLGLVTGVLGFGLLGESLAAGTTLTTTGATIASTVVSVGLSLLYFVGLWTSPGRATLGMRILRLQVGNAFDGRRLDLGQAVRRWVGLGAPLQLAGLVPALASLVSGVSVLWWIALLLSTAASPTKQGLHDRLANSAMVQPADAGLSVVVLGCLVLIAVTVLMPILALIFLGPQIQEILSEVGSSI